MPDDFVASPNFAPLFAPPVILYIGCLGVAFGNIAASLWGQWCEQGM